ncbi:transposase [Parasphingorhabdus sp.]
MLVYVKLPLTGPEAVLTFLLRYIRLVAVSNSRLIYFNQRGATLRFKD